MRVGVPKEIKVHEYRVGMTPASVREAVAHGHEVLVEHDAGERVLFVEFPETGRSTTIVVVIIMVIRPDAITGAGKYFTAQDIEAEAQQHVQIFGTNGRDRIRRKAVHKALFDWHDRQLVDAGQQL